ncbi:uncharacterized protein LOC142345555 isoform X2 [Convolutriloba macropyga]|uniref:uncharacterized protein LOC142345555 isoform X2 n=1 Tax=Convolutriloba macropyga TaxID=536237 RepID=UPI003F528496
MARFPSRNGKSNHNLVTGAISEDVAEPYIRSLESAISSPGLFKGIVDEIIGDARQFVMDEQFIQDIWKDYLKSGKTEDESDTPDPETGSSSGSKLYSMAHYSSINAIQKMDQRTFNSVVRAIKNYRSYGSVAITKPLQAARFSTKANAALLAVSLAPEVISHMRQWWDGKIDGVECSRRIAIVGGSTSAGIAAGYFGNYAGSTVGFALGGPVGAGIGMVVGAVTFSNAGFLIGEKVLNKLSDKLFTMPRELAVKNAYKFLEVRSDASDDEINHKYRIKARRFHPDYTRSKNYQVKIQQELEELWLELQHNMQIIRMHRGAR